MTFDFNTEFKELLVKAVANNMASNSNSVSLEDVGLIVSRLLSKEPNTREINELLDSLDSGYGVQNALILIETFGA